MPATVLNYLQDEDAGLSLPVEQSYETCVLFADVSGFTALCEAMAQMGPKGDEYLAKHLNAYFGMLVKILASQGGDVFKVGILLEQPGQSNAALTCGC